METMQSSDRALRLVEDEVPAEPGSDWVGIDSLSQLLTAIVRYPRLTPAEERNST